MQCRRGPRLAAKPQVDVASAQASWQGGHREEDGQATISRGIRVGRRAGHCMTPRARAVCIQSWDVHRQASPIKNTAHHYYHHHHHQSHHSFIQSVSHSSSSGACTQSGLSCRVCGGNGKCYYHEGVMLMMMLMLLCDDARVQTASSSPLFPCLICYHPSTLPRPSSLSRSSGSSPLPLRSVSIRAPPTPLCP